MRSVQLFDAVSSISSMTPIFIVGTRFCSRSVRRSETGAACSAPVQMDGRLLRSPGEAWLYQCCLAERAFKNETNGLKGRSPMDVGATLLLPGGASSFLTVHNFPGIRHRIVTRHLQPCHGSLRSFTMVTAARTFGPSHFINREMSWLEFNQRVLDEALDSATPLLERVKFFCISSSNLDEFFEIRVAGLKQQIESDVVERSIDGLTASETFRAITKRIRRMIEQQYACWREQLVPALAGHGIRFLKFTELSDADRAWIENHYRTQVRPVVTPLAIDPAHPFPQLLNKSLNMM